MLQKTKNNRVQIPEIIPDEETEISLYNLSYINKSNNIENTITKLEDVYNLQAHLNTVTLEELHFLKIEFMLLPVIK
mgnify:CR=1 FL=1